MTYNSVNFDYFCRKWKEKMDKLKNINITGEQNDDIKNLLSLFVKKNSF